MEKKLKNLFAFIALALGFIQGAWAHTAPTFPSDLSKSLASGNTYYLYNPGSDRFVYLSSSTVSTNETNRTALVVTNVEGDVYTFKNYGNSYYMISNGNNVTASTSTSSTYLQYRRFRIESTDGGYTIQRDYSYNENYYLGNATGNSTISSNFTDGNISWQFYDEEGVNAILHYRAKKALYDALVASEDYSFAVEEYEALYANEAATDDELNAAAATINNALSLTNQGIVSDSEYPIFLETIGSSSTSVKNGEAGKKATLVVDQDATLVYNYKLSSYYGYSFKVYVDDALYQTINNYEGSSADQRYFIELTAGKHTIQWMATSTNESNSSSFTINQIGAYKTPTITVNLTQAGSLGTEVLYHVDHVKDVRKLVVKGHMNDDDWTRVNMMTGLFYLDLSETTVTSLPKVKPGNYFHKVKLPSSLIEIQASAFSGMYLEEIEFPSTLTTIGASAFHSTRIKEAIMPESVTSVGSSAFSTNESLTRVVWSSHAKIIPDECFSNDYNISDFILPEGLKTINASAFYKNYNNYYQLPSTLTFIGDDAFKYNNSIESLQIPDKCEIGNESFRNCANLETIQIGEGAYYLREKMYGSETYYNYLFADCKKLKEIEFPTSFSSITASKILYNCTSLEKVTFKSPTMVAGDFKSSFFSGLGTNIMIYVPSYLVNTYKLDPYWYNYVIMGFDTSDITDWTIKEPLTFYSQDRFGGTPNITIKSTASWTINGETSQTINNFQTYYNSQESSGAIGSASKIISNCDNVMITGNYIHSYYAYNKTYVNSTSSYGRWHFISLPFDIKVSDIVCSNNAQFAIRYYDGANRATNGTGRNWKNYDSESIIPAGTGFIIQVSTACTIDFKALDNQSKQNVVSNELFVKYLDAYDSEQSSNKGWNLVGNPWLSYYNIHKLNFTAPITVYNGYNKTYKAYSVIDDDYAIRPNEAFFVQCPDNVTTLSFPVDGRQTTSTIESQNGVKPMVPQASNRRLVDIELGNGEMSDQTRVVINERASLDYETTCDASKFIEDGTECPQIYTIENNDYLAINERPKNDGNIRIGMIVNIDGCYTLSAPRNQFGRLMLIDNETDIETDLSQSDYTFWAKTGTHNGRFELVLDRNATSIDDVKDELVNEKPTYYNISGQRVNNPQKGIYIVNGKKYLIK